MINWFLKAKHWQLFLLTFGIPMILQLIFIGSMITQVSSVQNIEPLITLGYFKYFPVIMLLFMGVYFGWIWSVAIGLQKHISESVTMKVKKFKGFFLVPVLYLLVIVVLLTTTINTFFENTSAPDVKAIGILFAVIFPVHLFSMFCIFYSIYFVAKTIKTVELQREVKFNDFAGEFFLLWFYFIGIWIIQPRINKIINV